MNYGIILDEPNEQYHATEAVSNSKRKDYRKRPSLYKKKHIDKNVERKETEAFAVGSGTHSAVLEGITAFNKEFCVLPEGFSLASTWAKMLVAYLETGYGPELYPEIKKNKKAAKELECGLPMLFGADVEKYTQAFKEIGGERAVGKQPLRKSSFDEILELINSVHSHPIAKALLSAGDPEVTFRHDLGHFSVQCRADWWCESAPVFGLADELLPPPGSSYVCDLKTTQSLDDWVSSGFNNTISKFGYDEQEAFYRMVINTVLRAEDKDAGGVDFFYFIVVEKQEPKECAVFVIDSETIKFARGRVLNDLKAIGKCYKQGVWPGFRQDIITTEVSQHVRDKKDTEDEQRRQISEA